MTNIPKLRKGKLTVNPLHLCSGDAKDLGLFEGDNVCVYNDNGSIVTGIEINDDLRAGAVAMSHGYGGLDAKVMKVASRKPGANCNRLMPVGPGSYEPLSHMSWMSGVPVRIEKVV